MDKIQKHNIAKLWIAGAILMALCIVTDTFAQEPAAAADSAATTVAETSITFAAAEADVVPTEANDELANGLNTVWMLLAAMLVFFMQPGFALVEAGFTRTKNTANILMKNFVDFMFGSLLYWLIGFGLMFGAGSFVGAPHFIDLSFYDGGGLPAEGFLVFQTVFCATAATIVSGAMAERTKFSMYLVYTIFISVLIYPISGHWTWGGGWLMNSEEGSFMMSTFGTTFHDFAGSTIVHSVGGWIALVGAAILGPRIGKYGKDGKSKAIPGHNLTIAALDTNFAGADGVKQNGDRAYSSYVTVAAPFKLGGVDWTVEAGATPWETSFYGSNGLAVVNLSLGASKEIKITDSFSLPLYATATWNPRTEGAYFVVGISF